VRIDVSDRQFTFALLFAMAAFFAVGIAFIVHQSNRGDVCDTACDPYKYRIMSDGCYCRTATGWERHQEDE